jgi:hypothetical protein
VTVKASRSVRISRIAAKLSARAERQRDTAGGFKKPLRRKETKPRVKPIIAYDLETSNIKAGTLAVRYLTAYGANFCYSGPLFSIEHLGTIIATRFLLPELKGCRFVAWNGNNFDVYFIAAALLHNPDYLMRPYLTRSKSLRGLRVQSVADKKQVWEFLDGIAMTGLTGTTLKKFLGVFAPDFQKLDGPDFEREEFDAGNIEHVRYAERDSEGLYHAIVKAQQIVFDNFGVPLYPTIGNTGIRIFQRNMPPMVQVWAPPLKVVELTRDYAMRGGYCWINRRFEGSIWKYDLNQAYAAAMREAYLPAGRCIHYSGGVHPYANASLLRLSASNAANRVPFYYTAIAGKAREFGVTEIADTWLTGGEYAQLKREGWKIEVSESYFWDEVFTMKEYVDALEGLRMAAPDGPNGALGLMLKAIGNNSYGKTVEKLDGLELVLSADQPEGYSQYQSEDDLLQHVWFKFMRPVLREYHQPQLGAFITAHVRMVVRRAALIDPQSWLYADTDCVAFDRPIDLNLDAKRYGFWKIEVAGERYRIITKKVYAKVGGGDSHAKGLNVKRLTDRDFEEWFNGRPPLQTQLQRQNFVKVMQGFEMFITRSKVGQITPFMRE